MIPLAKSGTQPPTPLSFLSLSPRQAGYTKKKDPRVTDPGVVEVDQNCALLHYSPVSPHSHWLLPSFCDGCDILVGPGTMLVEYGYNDSLSITLVGSLPFSWDLVDVSALVRCHLGCDARIEAMAFDGRCQIVKPPACIRFIPKFRRTVFCMRTGEFLVDPSSGPPTVDIGDAAPYYVTFDC